jgi:hypothetical protein
MNESISFFDESVESGGFLTSGVSSGAGCSDSDGYIWCYGNGFSVGSGDMIGRGNSRDLFEGSGRGDCGGFGYYDGSGDGDGDSDSES